MHPVTIPKLSEEGAIDLKGIEPVTVRQRRARAIRVRLPHVKRRWLRFAVPLAALAVLLGGGGLAALETQTVGDYGDGVLWALSLMTTVGFVGGIPHTVAGKLIAGVLMLCGFSLLALTTAAVSSLFVREDEAPEEKREQAFELEVLQELRALHARLDELDARSSGGAPRLASDG